jgi:hypothetical protein
MKPLMYVLAIILVVLLAVIGLTSGKALFHVYSDKDKITYQSMASHCPKVEHNYFYPCLKRNVFSIMSKGGASAALYVLPIALKSLEEDEVNQKKFLDDRNARDATYRLNSIDIILTCMEPYQEKYDGLSFMLPFHVMSLDLIRNSGASRVRHQLDKIDTDELIKAVKDDILSAELQQRKGELESRLTRIKEMINQRIKEYNPTPQKDSQKK